MGRVRVSEDDVWLVVWSWVGFEGEVRVGVGIGMELAVVVVLFVVMKTEIALERKLTTLLQNPGPWMLMPRQRPRDRDRNVVGDPDGRRGQDSHSVLIIRNKRITGYKLLSGLLG